MPAPFYLVGPTAVGKTSLAVEIAGRCGAEIVSADAFQVYRGLESLTASPTLEERRRAPHHLVGTLPLGSDYNVARFLEDARVCLAAVAARAKPALVVGGSGLYVRALTHGLSPLPPARPERRAELEPWDTARLLDRLRMLDPAAPAMIDTKNKRRVIRAIEICEATGRPLSASRVAWQQTVPPPVESGFFLVRDQAELNERIERRTDAMLSAGVLDQVAAQAHTAFSVTSAKIIGLVEWHAYLRGEIDLPRCLETIKAATRRYAKRQLTWFRKSGFEPVNLSVVNREHVVAEATKRMMASRGLALDN